VAAGGRLFISGQNVGEYSWSDTSYYSDCLHAEYTQNITDSLALVGGSGDPIGDGLSLSIEGGDGADNQTSPDGILPLAGATAVFSYTGASGQVGGLRAGDVGWRVVYLSFGFEAVNSRADRAVLMERVMDWLLVDPLPIKTYLPLILRE
jgi:hypothetical protein